MNPTAAEDEDVVTASLAGRFAVTLGHPVRRFAPGDPAPLGLHWCLAPEYGAALEEDGIAADGIIPALDLSRRLWGGATIRHVAPLRVGDTVRRRSRVVDVSRKEGRSGPLAFARISHRFLVEGDLRIEEEQTIVYRDGALRPDVGAAQPCSTGHVVRRVATDPAMLFRFSALTFNAHRIHYDPGYAAYEGLPERLVHGTLTAALLLDAAGPHVASGARLAIQARRPIPCGATIALVRASDGDATRFEARVDDAVAMTLTREASGPG